MAKLEPQLEVIKRQKVKPTEGEWALLNFLIGYLDDSYEIYFQPYLNGDNPDIVIMRQNSGVLIVEVKDWNLMHYWIDDNTKWHLQKDNIPLKSPLKQVENYKDNLFKLHVEELFLKNIKNKKHWAVVNCAVYFHNATETQLTNFLLADFQIDTKEHNYQYYRKFVSYFGLLGNDSLNKTKFESLFTQYWLNKKSLFFDDTLYNSFHRYLKTPIHQLEEGIPIIYSREQQELIRSEIRPRRKIKGVAGSGKTLVLAKRAVNAHKRTDSKVLILTFNLSLKNYIHDRISDVRELFNWNSFYVTNYHQFFKAQANNYNLEITGIEDWQNTNYFESVKNQIIKFEVILIDEIQDYKQEWLDIITKYFMHPETEFVVFGDEKQNIYERELDENNELIVKGVAGNWNKSLNTSHRFSSNIGNLAVKFQKNIFDKKYNTDEILFLSQIDFEKRIVEYYYFEKQTTDDLFKTIYEVLLSNKIHPSDVGILSSKVEILRSIDFLIRNSKNEKTTTTFESQEEFISITNEETVSFENNGMSESGLSHSPDEAIHRKLEEIRKMRKNHFWMKTGTMKLATVHSFKGWEIDTLFLIIEREANEKEFTNAELIYTGLTRARRNLIVFNLGNKKYDSFFRTEIDVKHEVR